ncbi:MAG TPA: ABC transporter ATP-binding protein [Solirubrobacteraceae bacterium]|nr:ABC transporter ATP-binding protein [Solirubrobacteraceae bacterium]
MDELTEHMDSATATGPLLRVDGLTRHFSVGGMFSKQVLHAVDDVDFTINEREIVALVGESGSGKSTIARLLAGIYKPTAGEILYRGRKLSSLRSRRDLNWYRSEVAMVFQDPFSAFNPVHRINHGIMRNLALHRPELSRDERRQEAERVCQSVGLTPRMLSRYPHEMSGGERQRIGFAQALALRPKLILADEPVSMLDVSIRAGVLNMMAGLRDQEGVSLLYITHDLASARYVADRIIVMYAGQIAEAGPTETVLSDPQHPYTRLLLSAVAEPGAEDARFSGDTGEPPRVINPDEGCRFRWRCPLAIDVCHAVTPRPTPIGSAQVACHVAVAEAQNQPAPTSTEAPAG